MRKILNHLFEHKTLTRQEAEEVLTNIAQGTYSDPEIAAFLTVYLMRSITVEELTGFRDALLNLCIRVDLDDFDTIDLCGTGGDGKDTFNISTLTSFVVAGAGAKVSKHGNYAVSSACGSSNVMEYLGYKFSGDQDKLKKELDKSGICFIHAPLFNPAMKNVAPVRKSLRIKTFFNMLGPMVNPGFPKKQMVGVFSLQLARLYNYLYQRTDKEYIILHSLDGYDEISLTAPFKYISNDAELLLTAGDLGFPEVKPQALLGGNTVEDAAVIFKNILEGKGTPAQNSVIIANAAIGLKCYYKNKSIADCLALAKESLEEKKAYYTLKNLIALQ
ncbi:MAG: anthranilate phosphoribosyltransferase [Bacteroidales bacterium]|nr:anthranilate phosphoribosyltransferase [Bacteroidales bacterium]